MMKRAEKLNMYILHERKEVERNIEYDRVRCIYFNQIINSKNGKKLLSAIAKMKNIGGNLENISIPIETKFLGRKTFKEYVTADKMLMKLNLSLEEVEKCFLLQFKDEFLNKYFYKYETIPTRAKFQDFLKEENVNIKEHFKKYYKDGFSKKKILNSHIMFNTEHFKTPKFINRTSKFLGEFDVKKYPDRKTALLLGFMTLQRWIHIPLTMEILKKELCSNITVLEYELFMHSYGKERLKNYYINGYVNDFKVKETFPEQFVTAVLVYLYDDKDMITYEPSYDWLGRYLPDFELKNTFLEVTNWNNGKGYNERLERKRDLVTKNTSKNFETINLNLKKNTLKQAFDSIKHLLLKNNEPIKDLNFEDCDFKNIICSGKALQRQEELRSVMKLSKELNLI